MEQSELDLRQKLTYLSFAVIHVATDRDPLTRNGVALLINAVLSGDKDPREWVHHLHTTLPGHVGADGVMVPFKNTEED